MKLDVYNYIKLYIKEKYPMYFRALNTKEFLSFVNSISSNSLFKNYDTESIKNGETDKIIDDLVNNYAQIKLTNIWANFGALCDCIRKAIIKAEPNVIDELNADTFENIVMEIALDISKESKESYKEFMNGSYDKIFLSSFAAHCDIVYKSCYNHIVNLTSKYKFDEATYEYLSEQVLQTILLKYNIEDIVGGNVNDEIINDFNDCIDKLSQRVRVHIINLVNQMEVYEIINVDISSLVKEFEKKSVVDKEISAYEIISGKKDKYIKDYIMSKKDKKSNVDAQRYMFSYLQMLSRGRYSDFQIKKLMNKIIGFLCDSRGYSLESIALRKHDNLIAGCFKEFSDAKNHIHKLVSSLKVKGISDEQFKSFEDEIFDELFYVQNCELNKITNGECDKIISSKFSMMIMKYNSVQNKNAPKKVKDTGKKKKMPLTLKNFFVFSVATIMFINFIQMSINGVNDIITTVRYNSASSELNGDKYNRISTKYNDGFSENAELIIEDYEHYSKYGEEYGYMGFYEAYKHTAEDRLAIMDSMLNEVSIKLHNKNVADLHIGAQYYLEFVYDRLEALGCDEIKDSKFLEAISFYSRTAASNNNPNKTTMDCIDDKKVIATIEELMELYDKYSSICYSQLSEIGLTSLSNVVTNRRNV